MTDSLPSDLLPWPCRFKPDERFEAPDLFAVTDPNGRGVTIGVDKDSQVWITSEEWPELRRWLDEVFS